MSASILARGSLQEERPATTFQPPLRPNTTLRCLIHGAGHLKWRANKQSLLHSSGLSRRCCTGRCRAVASSGRSVGRVSERRAAALVLRDSSSEGTQRDRAAFMSDVIDLAAACSQFSYLVMLAVDGQDASLWTVEHPAPPPCPATRTFGTCRRLAVPPQAQAQALPRKVSCLQAVSVVCTSNDYSYCW